MIANFSHRLTSWKSQKYNISIVVLQITFLWVFEKWFNMKTSKKKTFISQKTYLYRPSIYTDHRHFWSFYFVHIVKVLSLKNSHHAYIYIYIYIPPYMHKALPTLGNKKEQLQIKFYEKSLSDLMFSRTTKNLKMFYFNCPTGWVLEK